MTDTLTHAYIGEITKFDRTPEGDLVVFGKAAGTDLDLHGERCDPAWLRREVPAWFEWGNVREQHSQIAAGVGYELDEQGDDWHIKALITNPSTIHKVETGTLKGWSLGAINARTFKDAGGQTWLVDGKIVEFSLVDRPSNPTTTLNFAAKSASGEWEPVPFAGEVIASVAKAARLDEHQGQTGLQAKAAEADEVAPPAFDRGLALAVATAIMRKSRPGALSLVTPLVTKAVTADGVQDEAPDIAGGKEVIRLLAQLIASEASELGAGYLDESCDITLLVQATECVKWWLSKEIAAAADPDEPYDTGEDETTYVLLSPEASVTKSEPKETAVPEPTPIPAAAPTALDSAAIHEIAKAAAAEATKAVQAEMDSLRGELAQVKSTVIPGGPYVVAPPVAPSQATANKAAGYWEIARTSPDPSIREAYRALAVQTDADARAIH